MNIFLFVLCIIIVILSLIFNEEIYKYSIKIRKQRGDSKGIQKILLSILVAITMIFLIIIAAMAPKDDEVSRDNEVSKDDNNKTK